MIRIENTCTMKLYFQVCDVWMVVQRKWMYLESIFIGGDIRSVLVYFRLAINFVCTSCSQFHQVVICGGLCRRTTCDQDLCASAAGVSATNSARKQFLPLL